MSTVSTPKKSNRSLNTVLALALIALLFIVLLLPPVSLADKVTTRGMEPIRAETDSNVRDPDGTQVAFPAAFVASDFKAKLQGIPRQKFVDGTAGDDAEAAANALPGYLSPRSPLYELQIDGKTPLASVLTVPIPNDSEPYATLDLYEWTGSDWQFVPGHVSREDDTVLSELNRVPASFMVMQTDSVPPTAAAVVPEGQGLPDAGRDALTEVTPYGLSLQGDGSIQGNITAGSNAGGSFGVLPVLRNWGDDGVVRTDLFENLLVSEELQQAHIEAIVNLVVGNNYPGIEIDYRGLDPTLSQSYTDFISKVAEALHAKNKTLAVRVEAPTQIAEDRWSTGGYSWRDLSQVVDTFRIPALIDPNAYAPGGQMDSMLTWAVGEAPRHKVELVLPARSVEKAGQYLILQGYDEALTPLLGESRTETPVLVPGEPVDISLINDRVIGGLSYDDKIGMFTYNYRDDAGYMRTVWIENAASIQKKLEIINTYNLKGASLEHMLQESYDPDIWSVVREFLAGETSQRDSKFAVRWQVTDPNGQVYQEDRPLDAAGIKYTPPQGEGQIQVSANIVDNGKLLASAPAIALALATATPAPTPTPEVPPTPTPVPTPDFASVAANQAVNLRSGPATSFSTVGQLQPGETRRILGKNQDASWWQIEATDGGAAWVIANRVSTQGPADQIAVAQNIPQAPQQVAVAPAAPAAPAAAAAAPAAAPAAPAPKPTGGGSFGYGIQISPWDLQGSINQIKAMGFNWVKVQVPWKDLEGSPGNMDWGGLDGMVNAFNGAGLSFLASVPKAPSWARPGNTDFGVEGPPADPATFANFLGQMAGRYCGKINAIEVWNEQNLYYEWGSQPIDPAAYMALLKPAYRAIKAACPTTVVVSGALTPTGAPAPQAMDDFAYLEGMYQNGLKDYADAIGAHPSGFNLSPDVQGGQAGCDFINQQGSSYRGPCNSPHHSWSFRSTMEGYRNIMAKYGDSGKRIWPTEFGWASGWTGSPGYEYANDNTLQEQAEWTVRAYQLMKSWGYVGPAFLWNLNYGVTNPGTELAQWGIVGRPAYDALASMPK